MMTTTQSLRRKENVDYTTKARARDRKGAVAGVGWLMIVQKARAWGIPFVFAIVECLLWLFSRALSLMCFCCQLRSTKMSGRLFMEQLNQVSWSVHSVSSVVGMDKRVEMFPFHVVDSHIVGVSGGMGRYSAHRHKASTTVFHHTDIQN